MTACRNTSTASGDTFEENPNTVTMRLRFFLGTSPNPAHAGDRLLSEIPAPVPPPSAGSTAVPPMVPALTLQTPERSPLWRELVSLHGSCMMRVVGTAARGWENTELVVVCSLLIVKELTYFSVLGDSYIMKLPRNLTGRLLLHWKYTWENLVFLALHHKLIFNSKWSFFHSLIQEIWWFSPPSWGREQGKIDISMFIKNRIWQMQLQAISPFAVNIFTLSLWVLQIQMGFVYFCWVTYPGQYHYPGLGDVFAIVQVVKRPETILGRDWPTNLSW